MADLPKDVDKPPMDKMERKCRKAAMVGGGKGLIYKQTISSMQGYEKDEEDNYF